MRLKTKSAETHLDWLPLNAILWAWAVESSGFTAVAILLVGVWRELELSFEQGHRRASTGKPQGRILKMTSIKEGKLPEATLTYHHLYKQ